MSTRPRDRAPRTKRQQPLCRIRRPRPNSLQRRSHSRQRSRKCLFQKRDFHRLERRSRLIRRTGNGQKGQFLCRSCGRSRRMLKARMNSNSFLTRSIKQVVKDPKPTADAWLGSFKIRTYCLGRSPQALLSRCRSPAAWELSRLAENDRYRLSQRTGPSSALENRRPAPSSRHFDDR